MKVHLIVHRGEPERKGIVIGLTESDVQEMRENDGMLQIEDLPDLSGRHELFIGVFSDDEELDGFLGQIGCGSKLAANYN